MTAVKLNQTDIHDAVEYTQSLNDTKPTSNQNCINITRWDSKRGLFTSYTYYKIQQTCE